MVEMKLIHIQNPTQAKTEKKGNGNTTTATMTGGIINQILENGKANLKNVSLFPPVLDSATCNEFWVSECSPDRVRE